jgi:hypothetical protein
MPKRLPIYSSVICLPLGLTSKNFHLIAFASFSGNLYKNADNFLRTSLSSNTSNGLIPYLSSAILSATDNCLS